jgi:hypothetical protein
MQSQILYFIISFIIGCIFSCAELLSRYKNMNQIFSSWSSIIYLLINGLSALLAYSLISKTNILENNELIKTIIAGGSSMLILRSSFASLRVGDKNIKAGLAEIIQIFLDYAEHEFDLDRSRQDAEKINNIMLKVDFEKSKTALPYTCFNLMKMISDEEKKLVEDAILELSESNHTERIKSINLGIILSNVTKFEFLKTAINILGDDILKSDKPEDEIDEIDKILEKLK